MAEIPFRILLDFREINFKFYKFVWMSVSPRELVTIKDLKVAILKKFSFERTDLLLYLRDGLLPEDENISNILRENDSIRLFYTEPCIVPEHSRIDLNDSRTFSYERVEESPNTDQVKSPRKRKEHSDSSEDNNEQVESNKKRKHSFSNGTYSFKNNYTPENSALISAISGDVENITNADLQNFENDQSESCKVKKKLKYFHDVSQKSLVSKDEIVFTSDIIPVSERNQSKVNSCKKKKKHKHSKDASENEIAFHEGILRMSEIDEIKSRSHKKKKKHKHSHDSPKMASVSESAVSFHDEAIGRAEKLNNTVNDLESRNKELRSGESILQEVLARNSECLKLPPFSPIRSSINTSSGISCSLKTSQESNQKISSEQNCSKYVSDKPVTKMDENNLSLGQGNNCKKKKRKRHRKRKSLLISPEVDVSNDNLDMSSQKNENSDSVFQTPEISSRNKEFTDSSKSHEFYSKRKSNCLQTLSSFVEPFGGYLPSTSTPFSETHAASPRKNSKMPSSFIASEDKSCSKSRNTILPAIQKTMNENYLSARSSPCSVTKNKNTTVQNHSIYENNSFTSINKSNSEGIKKTVNSQTDEIEMIEPKVKEGINGKFENLYKDEMPSCEVTEKNENYLSARSSPCSVTKNKKTTEVPNDNFHEKSSSTEINISDKSTDSFSNIGVKSRFLDPSFSYKDCPPLNSCPLVGTRIAYKILELDASYSPVVSNYKEGIVKAVNSQTDELEIELIEPEVKEGGIGKFENIYEDEMPSCEVIRKVTLGWSSLIDPVRVIY